MIELWSGLLFFLAGFTAAWLIYRRRGYEDGFTHGERFGRSWGYRQAWLKRHKPLLNAQREDWND